MAIDWIPTSERLPEYGVTVLIWSAESEFYQSGAITAHRAEGRWFAHRHFERFDKQDSNVFVTHWAELTPPQSVPSKQKMRALLHEDDCIHGIDLDERCEQCIADLIAEGTPEALETLESYRRALARRGK